MAAMLSTDSVHRRRLMIAADWLVVATAISLPWSTSATSVLVVVWLIVLIPTLDWDDVRRELLTPAGALPVALVMLGALGMLWADVSLAERWKGVESFLKLLVIPLLLVQYGYSRRGEWVFAGYVVSCFGILIISTILILLPALAPGDPKEAGVFVKSASTQSGEFVLCGFGLLLVAIDLFKRKSYTMAVSLVMLAFAFLTNIFYVAAGRTTLVFIPILVGLLAFRTLKGRALVLLLAGAVLLLGATWMSSEYLRNRVTSSWTDLDPEDPLRQINSSTERVEFARRSIEFIVQKPVFGHGTGSIASLFRQAAEGQTGVAARATTNPHNQTFAVAIQIGLIGAAVLWAMWIAHLLQFRGGGLAEWVGLMVVVQNVVGSAFNSHLFDFVQGWIYVIGVGVAGGMALKNRRTGRS